MKAYTQKKNQPHQSSLDIKRLSVRPLAAGHEVHPITRLQRTIGNQAVQRLLQANTEGHEVVFGISATTRFAHDFSQIPVHAQVRASIQPERAITTSGGCCEQGFGGMAKGGAGESPVSAGPMNPLGDDSDSPNIADEEASSEQGGATEGGAPVLGWSTASGPTTSDCGGFDWRINWELDKRAKNRGAIVQKVDSTFEFSNCAGQRNIYPNIYWEKWNVKKGKDRPQRVEGANYDDVFRFKPLPNVSKGKITFSGEAQFYPGQRPRGFKQKLGSQADALPMRETDPGLTGGTGPTSRSITVEWNCCSDSEDRKTYVTPEE